MNLLAIDTATSEPAVALWRDDRAADVNLAWREVFREVVPAIQGLLDKATMGLDEVDALVVPSGPGSFTGLRIGAALALGLAEARGIPLHSLPTLEAIAESCASPTDRSVLAILDARRGRYYAALYDRTDDHDWNLVSGPYDTEPERIADLAEGASIVSLGGADSPEREHGTVASAMAALVARHPGRYALSAPGDLSIQYTRPGVEPL